jgi:hypothetical protein
MKLEMKRKRSSDWMSRSMCRSDLAAAEDFRTIKTRLGVRVAIVDISTATVEQESAQGGEPSALELMLDGRISTV